MRSAEKQILLRVGVALAAATGSVFLLVSGLYYYRLTLVLQRMEPTRHRSRWRVGEAMRSVSRYRYTPLRWPTLTTTTDDSASSMRYSTR